MKNLIDKLQALHDNTQCRGTSSASMFRDVANFLQHDLETLINELHEAKEWQEEMERENALLRRMLVANGIEYRTEVEAQEQTRLLHHEHNVEVERRFSA